MSWWQRLTATSGSGGPRETGVRHVLVLLVSALVSALLIVDYTQIPNDTLAVGDVAPRTVKAPFPFKYQDFAERERRQDEAEAGVAPVYVWQADEQRQLTARIDYAFQSMRERVAKQQSDAAQDGQEADRLSDAEAISRADDLQNALGVHMSVEKLLPIVNDDFPEPAQRLARGLVERAMRGYVVLSREQLPAEAKVIRVIENRGGERTEVTVSDLAGIRTLEQAREQVTFGRVESDFADEPWADAAAAIARALVEDNFVFDAQETLARRAQAAAEIPMAPITVERGTTLFRQGDVLSSVQVAQYRALQSSAGSQGVFREVVAVWLFLLLFLGVTYQFGSTYLKGFSTRLRDVAAMGVLLVLTALVARATVVSSGSVAEMLGEQVEPATVWFVAPIAGAAMLVRLLIGVPSSLLFSIAAAVCAGMVMDLSALHMIFVLLSCVVAAGSVEHTRERLAVLRAGLFVGFINGWAVLLIHFLQLFFADGEISATTAWRPFWSLPFAFGGGVLSAMVVLALVPLFEAVGFVTDYRLMELANLNHPLLRQLMLRAPGTYHHSVIVGSLAEAACEAIGANALQARVAAYFHDIGKGLKPQYFVENQRGGNRHDKLDAYTSARIIISHVSEGGRMAKEHRLPRPIIENIYMHHGSGLLAYFYGRAITEADDPSRVDEAAFRYPGPKPNTREAGVIMLADKVEAATRTIKEPTEEKFRQMIATIINSVIADGQFEECPLTFREIYTISETFVATLGGIHHHRIEYAGTAAISSSDTASKAPPAKVPPVKPEAVITLDVMPTGNHPVITRQDVVDEQDDDFPDENTDYESVKHLPGSSGSPNK